jgi:hypothetical protein
MGLSWAAHSRTNQKLGCSDNGLPKVLSVSLHIHPLLQCVRHTSQISSLNWATRLRVRNDLFSQLSERLCSISTEGPTMVQSLNDIDGINIANHYHLHIRSRPVSIYIIITWLFFTIANIANRDQISVYISQVIGNHPTSTGLSMAKHKSTYTY